MMGRWLQALSAAAAIGGASGAVIFGVEVAQDDVEALCPQEAEACESDGGCSGILELSGCSVDLVSSELGRRLARNAIKEVTGIEENDVVNEAFDNAPANLIPGGLVPEVAESFRAELAEQGIELLVDCSEEDDFDNALFEDLAVCVCEAVPLNDGACVPNQVDEPENQNALLLSPGTIGGIVAGCSCIVAALVVATSKRPPPKDGRVTALSTATSEDSAGPSPEGFHQNLSKSLAEEAQNSSIRSNGSPQWMRDNNQRGQTDAPPLPPRAQPNAGSARARESRPFSLWRAVRNYEARKSSALPAQALIKPKIDDSLV